jgi:hypothetical protein
MFRCTFSFGLAAWGILGTVWRYFLDGGVVHRGWPRLGVHRRTFIVSSVETSLH